MDSPRLSNEEKYQSHNSANQIDCQQFKKIPKCLFPKCNVRVLDSDPPLLIDWDNGKRTWASIKHVRARSDGAVFWMLKNNPTGKIVLRAAVQLTIGQVIDESRLLDDLFG